jgi:DnaK suppressor protein
MTNVETRSIRNKLEARQRELIAGLDKREDLYIERQADSIDDTISASTRDFAVMQLNRNARSLREIKAALERLEEGTYGTCAECEDTIGPKRLAAIPWATLCVHCQESADQRREFRKGEQFVDDLVLAA